MSLSNTIRGAAARTFGKSARVTSVDTMSARVLRVRVSGPAIAGMDFSPGVKIKLHVGAGNMRSYTPASVDSTAGEMDVVVHVHGDSAASDWARGLKAGDEVSFMGPGKSVEGPSGPLPWAAFFGDETTIGLAEAIVDAHEDGTPILGAIEVASLPLAGVPRAQTHGEALVAYLDSLALPEGEGRVWLSGEASSVLALRKALLDRGVTREQLCIKPYWSVRGKAHRKELERTVLR